MIGSGRCAAVIEASDGAEDGRRKIGQALKRAAIARESEGLKVRRYPSWQFSRRRIWNWRWGGHM